MTRPENPTPRALHVAALVADGHNDKQIGAILGISDKGVSYHVRKLVAAWNLDTTKDVRVLIALRMRVEQKPAA
jgi:DNA-binding NarL/FixJ family response regulator